MLLNLDSVLRQIPLEVILLLMAVSTNLIKDLLNPELVKFIDKNILTKYFILFLIAMASSSMYLDKIDKIDKNYTNPIQIIWSLGIVLLFYLVNKLNYKIIIGLCTIFLLYYSGSNIVNYYKKYYN